MIGHTIKKSGDFYAKWKDTKNVFLIPGGSLKIYPKTVFDIRDKMILDFEKDKIVKLEFKYPDEKIELVNKGKNQWMITNPLNVKADEFEVSDLLWALLDIEAEKFVSTAPSDSEAYNFNKPIIKISLWEESKKTPLNFFISKKEDQNKILFAKTSETETVYQISHGVLKDLTKTTFSLRDKTLLTFKNEEVETFQLKYPDKSFTLKLGKGDWKSTKPVKTKLNKVQVISLLWDIKLLKFKEIVTKSTKEEPSKFGFDKPKAKITLWKSKKDKIGSLIIGGKVPNKNMVYARVDFSPTIYGVDPQFLEKLPYSINDLK